ncbi:guanylate-binding protein 1-like isoform X1 [Petromyzon marinus]|uniref:guanylate-binding protein 1-like isoform X1 n=1 Tax=Petromyzon marinus TaxID=7757 RepID=UPI003F6FDB57
MAVDEYAKGPLVLLESDEEMKFRVNRETAAVLSAIDKPLVVVAIAGRYRTGKSYLLNRLAGGGDSGFALGHSVRAHTRGIWVWPLPHPRDDSKCLLLLDTEGLGDINKGSCDHDTWLFVMSILLSSTLVLNAMRTLDKDSFELLHFVSNMAEHVNMKIHGSPSAGDDQEEVNYKTIFPVFVVCIRDSLSTSEDTESSCSADEFMEECLQNGKKSSEFKETCEMLCKYFTERKCFMFPMPAQMLKFTKLKDLPDDKLNPEFVETLKDFENYVLGEGRVKHINKAVLRGPQFVQIVEQYVTAQHSGAVPSIEDALGNAVKSSNEKAMGDALEIYTKGMESLDMELPMDLFELEHHHKGCMEMAVKHFHEKSVLDREFTHQKICMAKLVMERDSWIKKNGDVSLTKCDGCLHELFKPLKERVDKGEFKHPGGAKELKMEMEVIKRKYKETPGLGDQVDIALEVFLETFEEWLKNHREVVEEGAEGALQIYDKHGHEVVLKKQLHDGAKAQAVEDLAKVNEEAFSLKMKVIANQTGMDMAAELRCQQLELQSTFKNFVIGTLAVVGTVVVVGLAVAVAPSIPLAASLFLKGRYGFKM